MVSLYNHSNETCTVVCGDRIAQLVIAPYLTAQFQEADELDDTQRGPAASALPVSGKSPQRSRSQQSRPPGSIPGALLI